MRPLLSVVAILKNEARSVRALLESVKPHVDRWCILDTGSVDGTQAIICEVMEGVPGELREEPVVTFDKITDRKIIDFGATRNRVLDFAGEKSVFTLMLSGDEVLDGGKELREFLESKRDASEDAYSVTMTTGTSRFPYPRVLRTGGGRRYVFPIHEVPIGKNGETGGPLIPGVTVKHDGSDKARLYKRYREVDIPLLTYLADVKPETHEDHLSRARAIINLAQTHEALAEESPREAGSSWLTHKMAAMSYYQRRTELDGDPEEVNYAMFHYLNVAEAVGIYNSRELVDRLSMLVEVDPTRPEVRYMLAANAFKADVDRRKVAFYAQEAVRVAREVKAKPLGLPSDTRVEWLALRIGAECAVALNYPKRAKEMAEAGLLAGGPKEAFQSYLAL